MSARRSGRGAVHHAVDCSKEDGQSLVVETDDHARGREVLGVLLVLGLTPGRVHDRKLVRSQNKVKGAFNLKTPFSNCGSFPDSLLEKYQLYPP